MREMQVSQLKLRPPHLPLRPYLAKEAERLPEKRLCCLVFSCQAMAHAQRPLCDRQIEPVTVTRCYSLKLGRILA